MTTPCGKSLKPMHDMEEIENSAAFSEKTHLHFFSRRSLEKCFQLAGFSKYKRQYLNWMIPGKSKIGDLIDRAKYYLDWDAHLTYFIFN